MTLHWSVVDAFHATASLQRGAIFDDERLMPLSSTLDALTAAPGWVGADWKAGGTLLIAINPGGGGDNHRVNPSDDRLYGLIRRFRDAEKDERLDALEALSTAWIEIQRTHNIRRIIDAVLQATNCLPSQAAFLNVLPFRTRQDKPARLTELRRAWSKATERQVASLAPRRVVALGCKAHTALTAAGASKMHEIVLIKRVIGDSSISPHAQRTLAALRVERQL